MGNVGEPGRPEWIAGRVRQWRADEGWGVIDSEATPGGCWCHFSVIQADGYRELRDGEAVDFSFEKVEQDGWPFRAIAVRRTSPDISPDGL